jgi:ketosteroid isomerase-like protein
MSNAAAELAIRARRAAFNRAIAERDANAIGPILAKDCVMVTGSDSAVIAGRLAQVKQWRRIFAAPSPELYVRTPDTITISGVEPVALETGRWRGSDSATGASVASGVYSAKWRLAQDSWMIEAELFVTLA